MNRLSRMMSLVVGVFVLAGLGQGVRADEPSQPSWPKYNVIRYNENYAGLNGQQQRDWFDSLKDIPVLGDDLSLSLGGQLRLRYEFKNDEVFGSGSPPSDSYLLGRYRVHGDLKYQDWLRVFVEAKFAGAYNRDRKAPSIFKDHADFENLFADITVWRQGQDKLVVRVGRQELLYGKQRLVSNFDWANVMRTFDGAKLMLTLDGGESGKWQIDGWWTRLVQINNDGWNDADENTQFFGVYATKTGPTKRGYDLYILGFSGDKRTSANGLMGTDTRMTFGGRVWCKEYSPWDFEAEGAWQTGRFSGQPTNAWMVALEAGHSFSALPTRPRVSLGYDYASGDDDPTDNHISTFSQLFPLGHAYFGYIDLVGRQNIHAGRARVDFRPIEKVKAWAQINTFWLDSSSDALYNAGGAPIRRDMTGGAGSYVGTELDIVAKLQLDHHSAILTGYSHFWPGQVINGTGPNEGVDFVYVQYQFTF